MIDLPLLPDEVIEHTRQLLETQDGHQWKLGDHLVDVMVELGELYAELLNEEDKTYALKKARAHIIRQIANRTGADRSTLRDRHNMCRFFPPDIRVRYSVLSWSQLRACKAAGAVWEEYAIWACDNLPAPVAIIRARVKYNGDLPPVWIARWERFQRLGEMLEEDENAPAVVRGSGGEVAAIRRLGG